MMGAGPQGRKTAMSHHRTQRTLARALKLMWRTRTNRGLFLRAEDFLGLQRMLARERAEFAETLERMEDAYADRSEHAKKLAMGPIEASLSESPRTRPSCRPSRTRASGRSTRRLSRASRGTRRSTCGSRGMSWRTRSAACGGCAGGEGASRAPNPQRASLRRLVREGRFANRSQAIEAAVSAQLDRLEGRRLIDECAKLDPAEERSLAEEGLAADAAEWPEY